MTQDIFADYTYLSTLLSCPLQWHYRYVEMLRPVDPGAQVPLRAGKLGHTVLAAFYRGEPWDEVLRVGYDASGIVAAGSYSYMTHGHLETVFHNYENTYRGDRELRVATLIEQPLVSATLRVGGIPDMIVESEGGLVVWDHKFTTGWLANLETRLELSMQLPIYCLLASEHVGKPVQRAVLNMVHIGPGASNPKSRAERFSRKAYTYSEWQLEEAKRWIAATQDLTQKFNGVPPRSAGQHCGWCEYFDLCSAKSRTVQQAIKATNFKTYTIRGVLLSGADTDV